MHHSHFKLGMVLLLGSYTLLTEFRSTSYLLPVYDLVYFPGNVANFYGTLRGGILSKSGWYTKYVVTQRFLAPLAEGRRAIVIALCLSCVRLFVHPFDRACVRACLRASVNSSFKKLLLRNY